MNYFLTAGESTLTAGESTLTAGVSTTGAAGVSILTAGLSVAGLDSELLLQATAKEAIATIARNFFIFNDFLFCLKYFAVYTCNGKR
jgi:hypothetical protein